MKNVHEEWRYEGATLEQVYAMLSDPAFRERVCAAQGVVRYEVETDRSGERLTATIDQVQSTASLPGFARKFVGEEINIVQREEWHSPAKGDIEVLIPGKPGEMTGTAHLTEDPAGVTETVNLAIRVNIPIMGGKVESLIGDLLSKALRAEAKVGRDYLG